LPGCGHRPHRHEAAESGDTGDEGRVHLDTVAAMLTYRFEHPSGTWSAIAIANLVQERDLGVKITGNPGNIS
jgi:hypothetical protein